MDRVTDREMGRESRKEKREFASYCIIFSSYIETFFLLLLFVSSISPPLHKLQKQTTYTERFMLYLEKNHTPLCLFSHYNECNFKFMYICTSAPYYLVKAEFNNLQYMFERKYSSRSETLVRPVCIHLKGSSVWQVNLKFYHHL